VEVSVKRSASEKLLPHKLVRVLCSVLWPFLVAGAVFLVAGKLGYNPTDDGYLLSQSHRILLGQVPHRDFISPRPDLSAYLHLIDLALPLPRMIAVRVVGLTEILLYSLFLSVFIIDRPPWRWHPSVAALATIAFLVNLNVFPLMSWYTTDGILLIAIGLALVRTGSRGDRKNLVLLAFFVLGAAATVKQSFGLAPLLGALWLWKELPRSWARTDWFFAALAAASPSAIYVAYISLEGGWGHMLTQLTSPPLHEWGQQLVSAYDGRAALLVGAALAAQACLLWWMLTRVRGSEGGSENRSLVVIGAYIAIVTAIVFFGPVGLAVRTWGLTAMWSLIVFLMIEFLCTRTIDFTGLILLFLSWMVTLSFGFAVPDLVGGAIWLFLVTQALVHVKAGSRPVIRRWSILLLVMFAAIFVTERRDSPYFDVSAPRLSASLSSVSPEFGGIRTGPVTATYLREYAGCTQRYNEPNTAVFPDNPAMYSLLDLHNPFPTDWLWPKSLLGSENWIVSVARHLHEQGHFLVLFQTMPASFLRDVDGLPAASRKTPPFDYGSGLPTRILSALGGRKVLCGPFVGRYSP
jgi:hypothetical protein